MQNNKILVITIGILVVLVAAAVALFLTRNTVEEIPNNNNEAGQVGDASGDDLNSVVVNDQIPGDVVFYNNLIVSEDGFVVVRKENEDGLPGEVVGVKAVEAGDNAPGNIDLIESTEEGATYFIELYRDTDGDGVFNEEVDTLVQTSTGRDIRIEITTTEDLPEMKG